MTRRNSTLEIITYITAFLQEWIKGAKRSRLRIVLTHEEHSQPRLSHKWLSCTLMLTLYTLSCTRFQLTCCTFPSNQITALLSYDSMSLRVTTARHMAIWLLRHAPSLSTSSAKSRRRVACRLLLRAERRPLTSFQTQSKTRKLITSYYPYDQE